jgi:hypothetical protein
MAHLFVAIMGRIWIANSQDRMDFGMVNGKISRRNWTGAFFLCTKAFSSDFVAGHL